MKPAPGTPPTRADLLFAAILLGICLVTALTQAVNLYTTLTITGTWQAADADTAVAFTIGAEQAWGAVVDTDLSGDTRAVDLVRHLDTLFDDVDIATAATSGVT